MSDLITLDNRARSILPDPQTVTGAWVDVGPHIINTKDIGSLGVWVKMTINDSRNVRFRAVALPELDSADEYELPIQTVQSDIVELEREFFEFNYDEDTKLIFQLSLGELINHIKLQVQAGFLGATEATIDDVLLTKKPEWRA